MKRYAIILLLILLVMPVGAVMAAPGLDSVVEEGETVNNDIILMGGEDLEIQDGAVVKGDVIVVNGDITLAGEVHGDVILVDGELDAEETAAITGDCLLFNSDLEDDTASGLKCTEVSGFAHELASWHPCCFCAWSPQRTRHT